MTAAPPAPPAPAGVAAPRPPAPAPGARPDRPAASFIRRTLYVARRELAGYFVTPVAYVFIVIFLFVTGIFTFAHDLGDFRRLHL